MKKLLIEIRKTIYILCFDLANLFLLNSVPIMSVIKRARSHTKTKLINLARVAILIIHLDWSNQTILLDVPINSPARQIIDGLIKREASV